jgi:hypothetical protein
MPAAIYGHANRDAQNPLGLGNNYTEDGMSIGVVEDPLAAGAHLHKDVEGTNNLLAYHSDSSGIYMRATDSSAFSVWSMQFHSEYISGLNPHVIGQGDGTASDVWDIYGFSDAKNIGLLTANATYDPINDVTWNPTDPNGGNPTHPAVAHLTVANGFDGELNLLALDEAFKNVNSIWIHYNGFPHAPGVYDDPNNPTGTYQFSMHVDDIVLNQANVVPAAVPLPAGVWLFGTGLMGFLYSAKRKASTLVA